MIKSKKHAETLGEALARQKRAERSGFALIFWFFCIKAKEQDKIRELLANKNDVTTDQNAKKKASVTH